jgi:transposase
VANREHFRAEQWTLDTPKLVFIDESGVHIGMNRQYGWSPAGTQAVIEAKTRGKRLNVVAAIAVDGSRAMMQYEGAMNEERFLEFISEHLASSLNTGDIVVMDGLTIHKMASVREAIESLGCSVLILPAYSPEFNPIEHTWSTFKARLRAIGASIWADLLALARDVWDNLDDSFFPRWVRHCGYAPST